MKKEQRKVMVFGVFDGLHEGHRHFLRQARELGEHLIAVVALDRAVVELKGRAPAVSADERMRALTADGLADTVVLGDEVHGSWKVIETHRPHIIALGYDQHTIEENLQTFLQNAKLGIETRTLASHKPEIFHSRLLEGQIKNI